jgi:HD superfamily phosphodiesterase
MNLTTEIESAELLFKQVLEGFFVSIYDDKSLPSHGIDHHRRVWGFTRELIMLLAGYDMITDTTLPFKLIIACYLHDIGMSVDPGITHGHHSRDLSHKFLERNNLKISDYQDVLVAVENHDNKGYCDFTGKYDLLTILSVADDLDAFGFTGIYRYSEIYLTRGIDPAEIGNMIMNNATKRFDNFEKTFGFSEELYKRHKKRYDILINFFDEYNGHVGSYKFGSHQPYGYCGVIEIIKDATERKIKFQSILNGPLKNSPDETIRWFITGVISDSLNCP